MQNSPPPILDAQVEIARLAVQLHETETELRKLTQGQVDSVLGPTGNSYLLRQAQEQLQKSEAALRKVAETQTSLLNALPAQIALLDHEGVIVSVNDRWRCFASNNGLLDESCAVGQNYVELCEQASGACAEEAQAAATGIRGVLDGASPEEFTLEYPCHSPGEQRWFVLRVTSYVNSGSSGAAVMHTDVTQLKLAENKAQQQALEFMVLAEAMPQIVWRTGPDGLPTYFNEQWMDYTGLTLEESLGDGWIKPFHTEDKPRAWDAWQNAIAGKERYSVECRLRRADDVYRWWLIRGVPLIGAKGVIHEWFGTCTDIHDLKQAELAVRQSEEQFRSMFRSAAMGIAISTPHGRFLTANPAYCAMLGYTEEELKERDFTSLTHPEDLTLNLKLRDELLEGERDSFVMENRYFRKEGTIVWTRQSVSAARSENGDILRMIVVAEDYTERKRIESRFRRLVDSNVQGVFFWTMKGKITRANDAFLNMVGYKQEDVEAGHLDWSEMTPPEFQEANRGALAQLAEHGTCMAFEKEFVTKAGGRVPILIGAATFTDNPDEGVGFVVDLTERKKIEKQFLRNQRMESIGTLAGGIAHDLNNVLAPILMSIEWLKTIPEYNSGRQMLDVIEASSRRGASLVQQVLSFARGVEGQRVVVNLLHIARDLVKVLKETFPKSIDITFESGRGIWTVRGDPTQMHQVLLNLCVNARDAMLERGKMTIGLKNVVIDDTYAAMNPGSHVGSFVVVTVRDTGMGIPPEIRDRIFEPFFTTKGVGKGTGLGLSTTLAIVKSHGGFINLYSEMGKGTTFKVYFPSAATTEAADDIVAVKAQLPRGQGELVLVVDDEGAIREVAQRTLELFDYRVIVAGNGAEGVALYAQHRTEIAVVLTDMAMPIMDGPSMIIALKSLNPQIHIIGSSGLASSGGMSQAARAGVNLFVAKPYTAEVLLNALHQVLHGETAPSKRPY